MNGKLAYKVPASTVSIENVTKSNLHRARICTQKIGSRWTLGLNNLQQPQESVRTWSVPTSVLHKAAKLTVSLSHNMMNVVTAPLSKLLQQKDPAVRLQVDSQWITQAGYIIFKARPHMEQHIANKDDIFPCFWPRSTYINLKEMCQMASFATFYLVGHPAG